MAQTNCQIVLYHTPSPPSIQRSEFLLFNNISVTKYRQSPKRGSQFGCVSFPRRRRGNNTKEQPFCIISNTYQNWEKRDRLIAIRLKIQTKSSHKIHKSELLRLDFVNLNSWIAIFQRATSRVIISINPIITLIVPVREFSRCASGISSSATT